jgi:putative SOS response-associated peptidase YedK
MTPNTFLADVHDRMPLILPDDLWLDPGFQKTD